MGYYPKPLGVVSIMSDNQSIYSTESSIDDAISHIRKHRINRGGQEGYFVSIDRVNHIQNKITSMLESGKGSPTSLIALNDELNAMRSRNDANALLLEQEKQLNVESKNRIAFLTESISSQKAISTSKHVEASNIIKGLQSDIFKMNMEKSKIASQIKDANPYDSDAISLLQIQKQEMGNTLTDLNNKLQVAVNEKTSVNRELHKSIEELKLLKAQQDNLSKDIATCLSATSDKHSIVKLPLNDIWLKSMLGKEGYIYVSRLSSIDPNNVRERVYTLMNATNKVNKTFWKQINDMFQQVFQFVKNTSHRVRAVIKPWLDEIETDIKLGTVKTIQYYKSSLEKIVKLNEQRKKHLEKTSNKPINDITIIDEIKIYTELIKRRTVRGTKSLTNKISNFWFNVKTGFQGFLTYFRRPKPADNGQYIVLEDKTLNDLDPLHAEIAPETTPISDKPTGNKNAFSVLKLRKLK